MASYSVVLDACILYPQTLRDLLLSLAGTGLFHPRWTERVNDISWGLRYGIPMISSSPQLASAGTLRALQSGQCA